MARKARGVYGYVRQLEWSVVGSIRVLLFHMGRRFGEYQTLVDLGRGGMADLYVASAQPLASLIATAASVNPGRNSRALVILKTLRPPVNPRRVEMFNDESRLGQLFDHPNVVKTHGVGVESGVPFLVLEYLEGQPIDRIIRRAKDEDPRLRPVLLWVLAESLRGLHYAHELADGATPLHIVHRDFTPENIFVTYDGRVKVLDFGIAQASGKMHRTTTGDVKGKLRYMAPEQALGLKIDRRSDLFSAGIMLWELCAGRSNGGAARFWKHETSDRDVFDDLVGGVYQVDLPTETANINAILRKALARDASERYMTAEEMRMDLVREIAQTTPPGTLETLETLRANTAGLVCDLFPDQRDRTDKLLARALSA